MNMEIEYEGGSKFTAKTRGHSVVSDQPADNGGADSGMTPPELLLAALGTCAAYYAAQYLKARNLPAAGVKVSVSAEKAAQPTRIGYFHVNVSVPSGLDRRHVSGVERAVHACLIHNTLLQPATIEIAVDREAVASSAA